MDISELSEKTFNLGIDLEHPVSLRANDLNYLFQLEKGLGLVSTSFCMQTLQNTLVVDPFGDLYSCFEEAGYPEFRVGHIAEQGVEWFPLRETYKTRHIANMPDCINCSVALACGGQCGVRCRAKTGDLFKPHCDNIKSVILEGIKLAYKRKQTLGAQAEKQQINRSETISMHA
jgi:radical SAM protein with 4Fe4S-binding SPASM domain